MRWVATICVALCGLLILSACGKDTPPEQRLLIVCESWDSVFKRIDIRDQFGLATKAEIEAVDAAILILNPVCTQDLSTARDFDIIELETALLTVLTAAGKVEA